jgi:type I restriction-modification system DNA methylase subunit
VGHSGQWGSRADDRTQQIALLPLPFQDRFDIDDAAEHGEVFTRRWVVELILDLVGYTSNRPLHELTVIEPACGSGAFLGPITERLSASCRARI